MGAVYWNSKPHDKSAHFLHDYLLTSVIIICSGEHCLGAPALISKEAWNATIYNSSLLEYRIQCSPFIGRGLPKCKKWCRLYAKRSHKSEEWTRWCLYKFRALSQRFLISYLGGNLTQIRVTPYGHLWKGFFKITVEKCNCTASVDWNRGEAICTYDFRSKVCNRPLQKPPWLRARDPGGEG